MSTRHVQKRFSLPHIILTFIIAINIFSVSAKSEGKCGENATYTFSDSGVLQISGQGAMKDYGADSMPWNPYLVKEVSISDGITHIGSNSFRNSEIRSVIIPSSVKSIGDKAFSGCKELTVVELPEGLLTIGEQAFAGCRNIVKIGLPATLTHIGKKAFQNCAQIESIYVSKDLEFLGDNAFAGCKALSRIMSLPDVVTPNNSLKFGIPSVLVADYRNPRQTEKPSKDEIAAASAVNENKHSIAKSTLPAGQPASSDVDINLSVRPQENVNTFALIVANENYANMPDVPFALNDGRSFKNYCVKVLGIPEENVTLTEDATLGNMYQSLDYIKQVDNAFKGDISLIIYYAGHGAPDESNRQAYLVPTDAYSVNPKTCFSLAEFYKELGGLKARNVKVFMDACFSGAGRTDDMLAQGGRSVRIVPKKDAVSGNVVVVSATSDDQTAWHYPRQAHGLFTYCLLKKIRETGGEATMGELFDYLEREVPKISIVVNKKTQTPTSQNGPALGKRWREWKVNN